MDLLETGKIVIDDLNKNGYLGYFVGGAVRDYLINRPIHDIDITTNATPEIVKRIFPKTIETGIKHGTVTAIVNGIPIEITTFRTEGNYIDYRHPEQVFFVNNLEEDLARRDFTINSIAMDKNGVIIDPFNGSNDLELQIIKAVGNARERFLEDPLRMLRALRFAAQLNFKIEEETWNALKENSKLISYIAIERIKVELDKIFASPNPENGLYYIYDSNLINWINELDKSPILKVDIKTIIEQLKQTQKPLVRWALYLNSVSMPKRLEMMQQLKMSNKEISNIEKLLQASDLLKYQGQKAIKSCLIETNLECCLEAVDLNVILNYIHYTKKESITKEIIQIDQSLSVRAIKDLAVNGDDLIRLFNKKPGPWIKEILDKLFEFVVYKELPNKPDKLLEEANKIRMGNNEG